MSRGNDDEPSPPDGGFFSSVVEESRDPIVSIDDAGAIVYANPAAEDALGRDAASLADRRLAELIPDATTNRRAASLRDRLVEPARLDDAGDVSVPLAAADGETRTFSVRFHAHDVDGKPCTPACSASEAAVTVTASSGRFGISSNTRDTRSTSPTPTGRSSTSTRRLLATPATSPSR